MINDLLNYPLFWVMMVIAGILGVSAGRYMTRRGKK